MSKKLDLTGQRFGSWVVLREAPKDKTRTMWFCRCSCGLEKAVWAGALTSGISKSCGKHKPSQAIDITGQRFGRWTVIEKAPDKRKGSNMVWKCICDCGTVKYVNGAMLRTGETKSCGCYNSDVVIQRNTKHGKSNTRLYVIWSDMKDRTTRKNSENYYRYGARGIKVCDEWLNDFSTFEKWAIENGYNDKLTIDRIDNNGDYEPNNCRWADTTTQMNNTSRNKYIEYQGETHTLAEWCRMLKLNYDMVRGRIDRGWEKDKWFIPPVRKKHYPGRLEVL